MSEKLQKDLINMILTDTDNFKEMAENQLTETLLSAIFNLIMKIERDIYLQEHQDSKNGFYPRSFSLNGIPLSLSIPRTRQTNFFPSLIPKHARTFPGSYNNLIESLLVSAKSIESLKMTLENLGLPYKPQQIEKIADSIHNEFEALNSRQLSADWLFISMDAKILDIRKGEKEVKQAVLFTAIGTDLNAHKEFLGSYLYYGNESTDGWKEFLERLSDRGVRRVLLWITDNFPGLDKIISSFFPQSLHQLCIVHMLRNAKYRLKKEIYKVFREKMNKVIAADSFEEAKALFEELLDSVSNDHPHFAKKLRRDADRYLTFTRFPKEIRGRIKSTNASENLHKELEKIRLNSGGYFQSEKLLWIKWGLFINNLRNNKWRKADPLIASQLYTLRKMFKEIVEQNEEEVL